MKMYLKADFQGAEATGLAIEALKAKGFTAQDLDLFSTEPIELAPGVLDRRSHMSLAVVAGAAVFFTLIVSFVYFTQYNYRLVTGGMPIFSFWATGVVFYEITMLGAILTSFGWFIWESGLLRRDKRIPVPTVPAGLISLRLLCRDEQTNGASTCLMEAGALAVEKLG